MTAARSQLQPRPEPGVYVTSGASFVGNQLSITAGFVVPLVYRPARAAPPVCEPCQRAQDHAAEHRDEKVKAVDTREVPRAARELRLARRGRIEPHREPRSVG